MVVQALADHGVEHALRLSGRRGAADLRRDLPAGQGPPHPGAARAGRGACRRGLCALDRQGRACVLVTSGPGATNAVTGLVDALMDSIPMVVITGQVADASDRQRRLPGMRHHRHHPPVHQAQLPGEEVIRPAARPARGLLRREAGRPGPVVIDMPKDIQSTRRPYTEARRRPSTRPTARDREGRPRADPQAAIELLKHAKKPVFYAGGGVINAGPEASRLLRELVH
jgi:acetolactate synthase-1/2/3 large subunit